MATPFVVTVDANPAVSYYDGLPSRAVNPRPSVTD